MRDRSKAEDSYAWNITKIAEAFGLSRDTVRKRLKAAGVQPVSVDRNAPIYRLSEAAPALFGAASTGGDFGGFKSPDVMPPKDRKDWFDSENARLRYERELRTLVPEDEVAREMSFLIKSVLNPIDGIIDTLERKADLTPKQATIIQREIDAVREQMYIAAAEVDESEPSENQ